MERFKNKLLYSAIALTCLASASTVYSAEMPRLIVKSSPVMMASANAPSMKTLMSSITRLNKTSIKEVKTMWDGRSVIELGQNFSEAELQEIINEMELGIGIDEVEIDRLMYPTLTPNDPRYADQWHYFDATGGINADKAWNTTDGSGVIVAVLDTGVVYHSDLAGNLVGGYDFISDPTMARDGDGRDSDASDPGDSYNGGGSSWHGTHVAGTVAAVTNNSYGVAGVAYGARILPVRVLGSGGGYTSDIADAIVWAAGGYVPGVPNNSYPAQIINMSLGGSGVCGFAYQNAINQAVNLGTTIVVAAGNSAVNVSGSSPANCNNVIVVAATNSSGSRAYFSNYGALVDIAAPGVNILSTHNTGYYSPSSDSYSYMSGTSMAAPHIAGVAALIYASGTATSPSAIETKLKNTARAFPGSCSGCGYGIADAAAAVGGGGGGQNKAPVVYVNGPYQGSVNSAINFSSAGTYDPDGSVSYYSWDFGDGYTSNQANPSHSYSVETSYTVSLMVTDNQGLSTTVDTTATVGGSGGGTLKNGVAVNGLSANVGQSIDYTIVVPANATDLVISISGGNGDADLYTRYASAPTTNQYDCRPYAGGNSESCTETNPQAGTWYVSVQAYASFSGLTLQASYQAGSGTTPNETPVADPGGPYTGTAGTSVSFTGSNSYDPDGQITTHSWNFGDGSSSSQTNPRHTYTNGGSYNVTLTVTDNDGASNYTSTSAVIEGGSSSGLTNACAAQAPQDYVTAENGTPICVSAGTGGALYFYFDSNGSSSATIRTEHGSGNADLYFSNAGWPSTSNYTSKSATSGNTETITINNLTSGWNYIMVNGSHSGLTLQLDLQ
ncbi:S8 family serine peptidase [Colwellia sp. TT2012]|uniref:S8 family serine peptidase n=1 Tax=Colwellia sp. TT2012 TaxID=1720342 RepID=UPI00070EA956|nr:S8 family serine peptidase [Colwellia sp. TT2012]